MAGASVASAVWTATEWTALGNVLSGAGAIVGAVAVIAAAWFGASTFNSWRTQTLSARRIEQAERILTATYKVRRGLSYVRQPIMWASDLLAAEDYLKENGQLPSDDQRKQKLTSAQVYFTRLNTTLDDRRALDECLPMARALFGEPLELALDSLNRQFQIVNASAEAQYRFEENTDRTHRDKVEATLWAGYPSPEQNEMDRTIASLVKGIEDICVPVLRLEK